MDVLTRVRAGGREIECGLATTRKERSAVMAQRFRVYRRRGYYLPGLTSDRDAYDARAAYFLATLLDGADSRLLLGSARLILGEPRVGFTFPVEEAFEFELPVTIRETTVSERVEVTRVVAEAVQGIVIGGLLTPLGLIQAIALQVGPLGIRCGLAVIKQRFLRALQGLGVRLHEIAPARLIYPKDGMASGYYHHHPDPVVPVFWRIDEIAPSVEQAIALYDSRYTASPPRGLPTIHVASTRPESTGHSSEVPADSEPAPPASIEAGDARRRIP